MDIVKLTLASTVGFITGQTFTAIWSAVNVGRAAWAVEGVAQWIVLVVLVLIVWGLLESWRVSRGGSGGP